MWNRVSRLTLAVATLLAATSCSSSSKEVNRQIDAASGTQNDRHVRLLIDGQLDEPVEKIVIDEASDHVTFRVVVRDRTGSKATIATETNYVVVAVLQKPLGTRQMLRADGSTIPQGNDLINRTGYAPPPIERTKIKSE
jgi:hypothetical protein